MDMIISDYKATMMRIHNTMRCAHGVSSVTATDLMDGSLKLTARGVHYRRRDPLDFETGGVLPRTSPVPVPMAAPDMGCHMPSGLAAILPLRLMLVDTANLRELRGNAETHVMDGAIGLTALSGLVLLGNVDRAHIGLLGGDIEKRPQDMLKKIAA